MKACLLHNREIDKSQWDKLISGSPQGSVFVQSGYLDVLMQGTWSGIMVYEDDELVAIMPISIKQKWGLSYALQPILAKYWGIAFSERAYSGLYKEYSFKKKVVSAIVGCIPQKPVYINYNFNPAFDYPLPFYWKGYSLQTRYTYFLDTHIRDIDELFKNYGSSLKTNLRRAQKNGVTVVNDTSAENLIHILPDSHKSGEELVPVKLYSQIRDIFNYGFPLDKCFSMTALNTDKEPIASSLFFRDNKAAYAMLLAVHQKHRLSAASALLMHEAIAVTAAQKLKFDFSGSMLEPVEAFDRHFGALPTPYLNISKKSRFLFTFAK